MCSLEKQELELLSFGGHISEEHESKVNIE